jgi:hypothetical protein
LIVEIVDENDHPISDARVSVLVPAEENASAQSVEIPLKELNQYVNADLDIGTVELSIEADLLQSYSEHIELVPKQDNLVKRSGQVVCRRWDRGKSARRARR